MDNRFSRTEIIIGSYKMEVLKKTHVIVFGIGGVGSYVVEALARSGIGNIDIVDSDTIDITNINRQLYALTSTIGMKKVDIAEKRCKDINPDINIVKRDIFYLPNTAGQIDLSQYDYVVDAIDTISGKIELIKRCNELKVPVISAMGAGNKINPSGFEVADIYKTSGCPLARVMRSMCRKNGIESLKVVYSKEKSLEVSEEKITGSTSFVPPVVGFIIAGEVIKDIIKI